MATKKFLIAPYNSGIQTNVIPTLIPDDAWVLLENVHLYEGRVEKRYGSQPMNTNVADNVQQLYSRLGVRVGTTNGAGRYDAINGVRVYPTNVVPGAIYKQGQIFGVGDIIFTSHQAAGALYSTVAGQAGTYDTATGALTINAPAAPNTAVYFYPSEPVMALPNFEQQNVNNELTYGFDTQFAYQFTVGRWERLNAEAAAGAATWTGTDSQFYWTENYRADVQSYMNLYVTNNREADGLRYWDGNANQWVRFTNLQINAAGDQLITALIIVGYKGRLLMFNTLERDIAAAVNRRFVNRMRFSDAGVIDTTTEATAFNSSLALPGFKDIPVAEAITSIGQIKDKLVVYCERSTWLCNFTGNDQQPFIFTQINNELGIESQYSVVPFDTASIGIGNVGIHACNGVNVSRIDQKITQDVFRIRNAQSGIIRVHGIRDYKRLLVFWTFPYINAPYVWPNRILVYNYRSGSWSFYNDSVTVFGYYYIPQDLTWNEVDREWQQANFPWQAAVILESDRAILAGNQQGYVSVMLQDTNMAQAFTITDIDFTDPANPIITAYNHNLPDASFIYIRNVVADNVDINDQIFQVGVITEHTFRIMKPDGASSNYQGGGTFALVPRLGLVSKQFNFFQSEGRSCGISQVDFLIDRGTTGGTISVDYATNSSDLSFLDDGLASGAALGTNKLELGAYAAVPLEASQDRLWHTAYIQANGSYIQLIMYFDDDEMVNQNTAFSPFALHAILFTAMPTSQRLT